MTKDEFIEKINVILDGMIELIDEADDFGPDFGSILDIAHSQIKMDIKEELE